MPKTTRRNFAYAAVETLGLAITSGRYVGADFPNESKLSEQLGVCRATTREVLKMLATKGMLIARPRHGTMVAPEAQWNLLDPDILRWLQKRRFSSRLMIQFMELRLGVEPTAAALAARNADTIDLAHIRDALARMSETTGEDAATADAAFHIAILDATKNLFYRNLHELVNTTLRFSIHPTASREDHALSLAMHGRVADAIAARDPVAAQAAMEAIVRRVLNLVGQTLPEAPFERPSDRARSPPLIRSSV